MYKICSIENCNKRADAVDVCSMHKGRFNRTGTYEIFRRANGAGNVNKAGYVDLRVDGRRVYEHVLVAEKAVGRQLAHGVVVHHLNEVRSDNRNANLVVCQDDAYHKLIHRRTAAYDACGNANYVRCPLCLVYDDPKNMHSQNSHAACLKAYARKRYLKNKEAISHA